MGQIDHNVESDRSHAHSYSTREIYPNPIDGIHSMHKGRHFNVLVIEHEDNDGKHHVCFSQTEKMHEEGGLGIDFNSHPAALATRWYNEVTQAVVGKQGILQRFFSPTRIDLAGIEKRNAFLSPENVHFYLHHPAEGDKGEIFKVIGLGYEAGEFKDPVIPDDNMDAPKWVHDALPTAENLNQQPPKGDPQHDDLSF